VDISQFIVYYLQIVFYTIGSIILCAFLVHACERFFCNMVGGSVGGGFIAAISIIGTPIHELGHAAMALIFDNKIDKIVLWRAKGMEDGLFGSVTCHPRPNKNYVHKVYHEIGELFISLGPIFSGILMLVFTLFACFPNTIQTYFASAGSLIAAGDDGGGLLAEGFKMLPNMFKEIGSGSAPEILQNLALLVIISISLHISLSPADIKTAIPGAKAYLLLALAFTIVTGIFGTTVVSGILGGLQVYHSFMIGLFVIVLVCCLIPIGIALAVRLIYWLITEYIF